MLLSHHQHLINLLWLFLSAEFKAKLKSYLFDCKFGPCNALKNPFTETMNCHVLHMSWLFACACSHCTPSTRSQTHPKTIAKCIEKSFYVPWRKHSFLHLLCCKNMKIKKKNYIITLDLKHTQFLSLFQSLCLTFMMCCQHKKYTHHDPEMHTWDQDTSLSTQAFLRACGYRTRPGMCVYDESECARIWKNSSA